MSGEAGEGVLWGTRGMRDDLCPAYIQSLDCVNRALTWRSVCIVETSQNGDVCLSCKDKLMHVEFA